MSHHACKFTKNKRNPTISRGKNCTETSKIIGQSYIRTVCYPESAAKDCASFDSMEQDTDPLGNTCNVYLRITGECVPQYQKNLSCSNVTEANCGKGTYYSCTRHP